MDGLHVVIARTVMDQGSGMLIIRGFRTQRDTVNAKVTHANPRAGA